MFTQTNNNTMSEKSKENEKFEKWDKLVASISLLATVATISTIFTYSRPSAAQYPSTTTSKLHRNDPIAVGLQIGNLPGVSIKYLPNPAQAIQLGVSTQYSSTVFSLDYLWLFRGSVSNVRQTAIIPYLGAGFIIAGGGTDDSFFNQNNSGNYRRSKDTALWGLRVPLGFELNPEALASLGIYAELTPTVVLSPESYSFAAAAFGARYYF